MLFKCPMQLKLPWYLILAQPLVALNVQSEVLQIINMKWPHMKLTRHEQLLLPQDANNHDDHTLTMKFLSHALPFKAAELCGPQLLPTEVPQMLIESLHGLEARHKTLAQWTDYV